MTDDKRKKLEQLRKLIREMETNPGGANPGSGASEHMSERGLHILSENPVFLATATTGLDEQAQAVEVAVLAGDGAIIMETLIKPTIPIPDAAAGIHGISDEMVRDAPGFAEVWKQLRAILQERLAVIYNAVFDLRILSRSALACDISGPTSIRAKCAMRLYAEYLEQRDWKNGGGCQWQTLDVAAKQCCIALPQFRYARYRAVNKAELTRRILLHMTHAPSQTAAAAAWRSLMWGAQRGLEVNQSVGVSWSRKS
ncbi:MAG: 3'-5' exonuclease [Gammaproteobacteria bacterium]|nr:3'-5' exonuclease [Gammaproteobacteria bacterium]